MASGDPSPSSPPTDNPAVTSPGSNEDADMNTTPLTMNNSLEGKLHEGRYYIDQAGEEFQKCAERLGDSQIDTIRQTHIRLTDQWREVRSTLQFPYCINPKNIHKAHRFADDARGFHKYIMILSNQSRRAMLTAGLSTTTTTT